jgi:hypothetical protein
LTLGDGVQSKSVDAGKGIFRQEQLQLALRHGQGHQRNLLIESLDAASGQSAFRVDGV